MNRSYPALRGIAILLVLLNHSIHMVVQYADKAGFYIKGSLTSIILSGIQSFGVFAVPIFLFLSGCFFAYAASRGDLKSNYRVVLINLKHVAIPYLIWSIIFYVAVFVFHGTRFPLLEYVKNLLVGYPFNFVPLLIFYYLVSPILIRFLGRAGWWVILIIFVYQFFLLILRFQEQLGVVLPGWMQVFAPPVLSIPLAAWAVYFPLGLIVVQQQDRLSKIFPRIAWLLVGLTVVFFAAGVLRVFKIVPVSLAQQLCPIPFILLCTTFQRNRIPFVRPLELLGKRAYGLYLTNLLVMDAALLVFQTVAPRVFSIFLILIPIVFLLALFVPILVMSGLERRITPVVYRYAFG